MMTAISLDIAEAVSQITWNIPSTLIGWNEGTLIRSIEHQWPWNNVTTAILAVFLTGWVLTLYWFQRWRAPSKSDVPWRTHLQWLLLATLRLLAVLAVLWMIAQWVEVTYRAERPVLGVLFDGSASMSVYEKSSLSDDFQAENGTRHQQVLRAMAMLPEDLKRRLDERFDLQAYWLDSKIEKLPSARWTEHRKEIEGRTPTAQQTRLGDAIRDILARHRGQTLTAIIAITDGVVTEGMTLRESAQLARRELVPLYFVGVGRPQRSPDLWLGPIAAPRIAFHEDIIPIQVSVLQANLPSSSQRVRLLDGRTQEVLDETSVSFVGAQTSSLARLEYVAKDIGIHELIIEVASVSDESDLQNNRTSWSIDVRDGAISVLLANRFPSFEFRFLKHHLERSRQREHIDRPAYKLTSILEEGDPQYVAQDASAAMTMPTRGDDFSQFDVILLGDISPSLLSPRTQESLTRFVADQGGGLLFWAGWNHTPHDFFREPLARLFPFESVPMLHRMPSSDQHRFRWLPTEIGRLELPLQLEADANENQHVWRSLPEQQWHASSIRAKPLAQVLAMCDQHPNDPLLLSHFVGAGRVVFQATDETYRWQTHYGDDVYYQRYWNQMIRWLAAGKAAMSQEPSSIRTDRPLYRFGEAVRLMAKLGTALRTAASRPELTVRLFKDDRWIRDIELLPSMQEPFSYQSQLDQLTLGRYRAELVDMGTGATSVEFQVLPAAGELEQTSPAVEEMIAAAESSLGKFAPLRDWAYVLERVPTPPPKKFESLPPKPIWNHPFAIGFVLLLLSSEWFLRRFWGLP